MPGIHLGLSRALFQIGKFTWLPSKQCWRKMILQASAAKIRIWKCLQINLVMHVLCSWRKLSWGLNHVLWHRLSHSLCRLDHELQKVHGISSKQLQWCWVKPPAKKSKRFVFYRDFLVHSRDLDSFHCPARSHGLSYNNCWAGLWGMAGAQRECCGCHSIWAGSMAMGRCGHSVTEKAASPNPPSQECPVTSLEPLPARQRGHPAAPPRRTSLSALNGTAATLEKAAVLPQKRC